VILKKKKYVFLICEGTHDTFKNYVGAIPTTQFVRNFYVL
jgi:hypothetical protein